MCCEDCSRQHLSTRLVKTLPTAGESFVSKSYNDGEMQTRIHPAGLRLLILLFVLLFVFFIYTFLHEAGHAITGLLFGQSLTEFNLSFWNFRAHVWMSGGELTESQFAMQAIAGAGLPLLIWVIFISLVPRKASFSLEALKLISSMAVLNTLLAWIVIPVLYAFGNAPPSDDVTHFLRYSQMLPSLLTFVAGVVYICGWAYFLSKIDGVRNEFLLFHTTDRETLTARTRTVLPVMIVILTVSILSAFLLNHPAANNSLTDYFPPQDFAVVAEIDLSRRMYSAETLAEFTVEKPAYVGVFIIVRNINTSYFDLRVTGPDGYSSVVLHGEGYRADRDGGLWEENVSPGRYRLVLTSNQSPGNAAIFLKMP